MSEKDGKNQDSKKPFGKWLIDNIVSLAFALLLVMMIRSSVIEPFKIPSGSMIPTLLIGDHIFVNKLAYGLIVPITDTRIPIVNYIFKPKYLFRWSEPKGGDIVVFRYPRDEPTFYIKRIVGLPGDRIELKNKALYINGKAVERKTIDSALKTKVLDSFPEMFSRANDESYVREDLEVFEDTLSSSRSLIMTDKSKFYSENFGPIEVPAGQYFVMGDNRDHSNDSRYWGFVPFENIMGRASVIWLSIWMDVSNSDFIFRPGRTGSLLR
jgi:signal peptidase I